VAICSIPSNVGYNSLRLLGASHPVTKLKAENVEKRFFEFFQNSGKLIVRVY